MDWDEWLIRPGDSGYASTLSRNAGQQVHGEMGGSSREVAAGTRDLPDRRQNRHGSYSADSPGRSRSHPYADYITENDLKKNF